MPVSVSATVATGDGAARHRLDRTAPSPTAPSAARCASPPRPDGGLRLDTAVSTSIRSISAGSRRSASVSPRCRPATPEEPWPSEPFGEAALTGRRRRHRRRRRTAGRRRYAPGAERQAPARPRARPRRLRRQVGRRPRRHRGRRLLGPQCRRQCQPHRQSQPRRRRARLGGLAARRPPGRHRHARPVDEFRGDRPLAGRA